ncbi:hypothetical protein B5F08_05365 [Anaeromassilibacillus sp. An172]|uniref:helix-turn-helix domain-containing protein n=1 Tax=Anaeromassilibacillus sp. An172 TaxID=1965570 RepID=UPI000B3791DA|nr:AraC family transcriptional regulator [Anaeromassilibacillus sp. An172]MEE0762564.1 AraC family transcriptional regulator [Acutalibacteraceae bacterium]OUP79215.1 hypothetical protein B5F08_05365 [Anaeromassilibacillus sp. An172]
MSNELYTIDHTTTEHLDARLLYVGKSKYGNDWHSTLHSHYFAEFFYVTSGKGVVKVEDTEFTVEESDLVIINPGVSHTEKTLSGEDFEYVFVGVDGIAFCFDNPNSNDDYTHIHYKKDREVVETYLKLLQSEMDKDTPYKTTVCQDLLELLIINIIRKANYSLTLDNSKSVNRACRTAKRYIDENFRESITLDELAEVAKVNKYYLSHAFSEDYKISPINYLISKRIDECKNLLVSSNYSIAQIAGFTGFSSPSYFSQCFKKNTGLQPEQYRKRFRAKGDIQTNPGNFMKKEIIK